MAKPNFYDSVMEGLTGEIEKISDSLSDEFKGSAPFNKVRVPKKKLLEAYLNLDSVEKQAFMSRYGQEALVFFGELDAEVFKEINNGRSSLG